MSHPPLFKAKLILPALPFILALLALVGWVLDIDSLKRGMASSVAMNPVTAVCMILLTFEALRLNAKTGYAVLYKAGQLAIIIVIAVSALKLGDLLFGSSFAIDQQLFSAKLDAEPDHPSRMAPNTAACFFILGCAMQLMRGQADSLVLKAQLLATGAMLLALLALVGHLFGAQELSGIAHYIPMAVNTAFAFVLISVSVLLARPEKGFMRVFLGDSSPGLSAITSFLLPASIFIPLVFGWLSHAGAGKGFYDMELALAIAVITSIMALLILSYVAARRLFLSDAESRQLHTALLQSDEAHHGILAATLDGFWVVGLEGKLLEVNSRYAEQSGYSREELLGMSIPDLEAAESASDTAAHIQRVIEKGRDQFESMHRRKDGSIWYVEVSTTFLASGGGKFYVFLRDINERKQAEKYIAYSEALFHGLFNSMSSGVAIYEAVDEGEDFIFKDFNPAAESMDRVKREDVLNKRVTECFPGVKEFGLFAVFQRVWKTGVAEHFPVNVYRDNRLLTWRDNHVYRIPSGEVVAVYDDVTERMKAQEQLRIASIAFESQDGMVITDANGVIQRVNQAFTEITGYTAEEAVGQTPKLLKSGRHDAAFYAAMWESIQHTGAWSGEIWNRRKNGEVYPERLSITAVKGEGGKVTHYVAAKHDISERKRAEAEIHSLAFYDVLTKLPNRRLFLDRFNMALTASARINNFGAVLFIDLDRFKLLNDTLGHDYGDLLLVEVAVRIKACVREMDTVARLGGDEFVVLIEGISDDQNEASHKVGLVAEKIRESLAHPYNLNGHEHHSSPSIGVTLFRGNDVPVDELLQHADMAMYQAKDSGRNAVRFFDPVMQNNVAARAALVNDLRNAIAQQQLHLLYQIQVDNSNRPVGAEALLRWIHP